MYAAAADCILQGGMIAIQKRNLILAIVVLLTALFLYFYGCPYLQMLGANKLCIAIYVLLLLFYIYARANPRPVRRRRPPSQPQP